MKTMNYLLAIALIFTIGSCSKETSDQDVHNEELAAVDFRGRMNQEDEKPQDIFELDLHQYYIINQLAKLDFEKKQLEEQIDGGRKDLIPKLELTMKSFSDYEQQLIDIHNAICHILGTIADELAARAPYDPEAKQKLLAMDESLKSCGIKVTYSEWIKSKILLQGLGKTTTVGGCQIPGRDFYEACDVPLPGGVHKILVDGRLDSMIITTEEGLTISKAELIDRSKDMDGFYEYALTIPSSIGSKFSIEISKENVKYNVPIKVSEDF